jgi:hypothetical protein
MDGKSSCGNFCVALVGKSSTVHLEILPYVSL